MGKGDKKSKRGKINIGSFGKSRPKKARVKAVGKKQQIKAEVEIQKP